MGGVESGVGIDSWGVGVIVYLDGDSKEREFLAQVWGGGN